jgi:hypothetical protein
MHKTTRELLGEIRKAAEMDDAAEAWMAIDYHAAQWKGAGYPDMDEAEAEPPTLGTCWTCAHDYIEDDGGHVCEWCLKSNAVSAWVKRAMPMGDDLPPLDYTGPPCPGWKAKE